MHSVSPYSWYMSLCANTPSCFIIWSFEPDRSIKLIGVANQVCIQVECEFKSSVNSNQVWVQIKCEFQVKCNSNVRLRHRQTICKVNIPFDKFNVKVTRKFKNSKQNIRTSKGETIRKFQEIKENYMQIQVKSYKVHNTIRGSHRQDVHGSQR